MALSAGVSGALSRVEPQALSFTMRSVLVAVLVCVVVTAGCVSVRGYTYLADQTFPAKAADARIDIYWGDEEIREAYIPLARFELSGTNALEKAEDEARQIGGDGMIVKGRIESGGSINTGIYEHTVLTVVVIRYED